MARSSDPTISEVRSAVERILASTGFAQAGRSSAFLRYVVEETLAGRGDRIKGQSIAIDVFDRAPDFDAQTDPLVRVEASRLRRRLVEFYVREGSGERVRVELRRGSYVPQFRYADTQAALPGRLWPMSRAFRSGAGVTGAVAVLLAALVLTRPFGGPSAFGTTEDRDLADAGEPAARPDVISQIESSPPRVVILPLTDLSGDRKLADFAAGLTEELNSAFVAFDIIASVSPNVDSSAGIRFEDLRQSYRAGYALLGSVRFGEEQMRLILRTIDTATGTQFWTLTIDETLGNDPIAVQKRVALRIAQMISSPFGPVFSHEMERIALTPTGQLNNYQCLLRFYAYTRSFDPALHRESVGCMQRITTLDPQFAGGWSALATLYLHEYTFGYSPQADREPPLDRALEAARTALDIDGENRVATITMAGIQRARGDFDEFHRAIKRSLEIRPPHPAALAQMGYLLVLDGEPDGRRMIDEAIEGTAQVPGWYYIAHTFGALQQDRYDDALTWALRIDAPSWFGAPIAVAVAAAWADRPELARREIERLKEIFPDFEARGREQLTRWLTDSRLLDKVIDGLALAGLKLS